MFESRWAASGSTPHHPLILDAPNDAVLSELRSLQPTIESRLTTTVLRPDQITLGNGGAAESAYVQYQLPPGISLVIHPLLGDLRSMTNAFARADAELQAHGAAPSANNSASRTNRSAVASIQYQTFSNANPSTYADPYGATTSYQQDYDEEEVGSAADDFSSVDEDFAAGAVRGGSSPSAASNATDAMKLKRENKRLYSIVRSLTSQLREAVDQHGPSPLAPGQPRPSRPSTAKERRSDFSLTSNRNTMNSSTPLQGAVVPVGSNLAGASSSAGGLASSTTTTTTIVRTTTNGNNSTLELRRPSGTPTPPVVPPLATRGSSYFPFTSAASSPPPSAPPTQRAGQANSRVEYSSEEDAF
eukprot:GILK01016336.1.p1 GENE.GILK01016336.1~~GILK01016336.1.p1  ORF type:complete len:359 (-),score=7.54 GILK01016336.1:63-1139(-)